MMRVIPDGKERFRLVDTHGAEVGWIRGRGVRVSRFLSGPQVSRGAHAAVRALEAALRYARTSLPGRHEHVKLRLVHDGPNEWISDGGTPIGRVLRPRPATEEPVTVQLVVPDYASDGAPLRAALSMVDAMDRVTATPELLPVAGGDEPLDAA